MKQETDCIFPAVRSTETGEELSFRIVLKGSEPSGRFLAVLCARTGETIDSIRKRLNSPSGMILKEDLTREAAELFVTELPGDGSVSVSIQRDVDSWVAVLVGYRPGSRGRLRSALQRLSKLSTEEVIHFLANIPIALKSGIDRKTAVAVKEILEREGGIVEIRPSTGSVFSSLDQAVPPEENNPVQDEKPLPAVTPVSSDLPGMTPEVPPKVSSMKISSASGKSEVPPVFSFRSPEHISVPAPSKVSASEDTPCVSSIPYSFSFTIPGRPVPATLEEETLKFSLPAVSEEARAIPLFLHPVGPGQRSRVLEILLECFDMPEERCQGLIDRAPGVVCIFRERINALVALRELSEQGVPVSMVSAPEGMDEGIRRSSFFGWLNGTM